MLRGRLAGEDSIYYELLAKYGVRHSNEFRDARVAVEAYYKLLARVEEYEADKGAMSDAAPLIEDSAPPQEEATA
jgi:hypothetical protein